MGLLYGPAGRLTAQNGGFRPGQWASFPGKADIVQTIKDAGDAMDNVRDRDRVRGSCGRAVIVAVAVIDRWPRTQAADSVRDAIQVHYMEEQGFHLIGFLKHGHPARVRGAVTLFGNYFSWDKTFTRDELFAGAAKYASKVVSIIVEWFEAGLIQGGSARKGELETHLIGETLLFGVSSAPFLTEHPCNFAAGGRGPERPPLPGDPHPLSRCTHSTLRRRPTPPSLAPAAALVYT